MDRVRVAPGRATPLFTLRRARRQIPIPPGPAERGAMAPRSRERRPRRPRRHAVERDLAARGADDPTPAERVRTRQHLATAAAPDQAGSMAGVCLNLGAWF